MAVERMEITQRLVWLARTPGCGHLCGDRFGHHAETHERYGAEQERARASARDVIVTGVLTVDLLQAMVLVDGKQVRVTGRPWQLLALLARRLGECVPNETVIRTVWGDDWLATPVEALNNVNSTRHRLRSMLGAAGALVVTRVGVGVQLFDVPAGDTSSEGLLAALRAHPDPVHRERCTRRVGEGGWWSRQYDRCQRCKRNDRPHAGRGLCSACHSAWRKARARGRELPPLAVPS